MENLITDERIHEGHRSRMRAKLLTHGQHIFDTYELLEMLLYTVVPYKDTNPISKRLLSHCDGLDGVFCASNEELVKVNGIGERAAEFIQLVGRLSDVIGAEIMPEVGLNFENYQSVGEYLVKYFSPLQENQVVAIFLDSSMRPIGVKKLYDLDFESGGVKARAFIDEAIRRRATVVISAHNHPFGPFFPTPGDRETNAMITEALAMAGIVHAEHYIVMGDSYAGLGSLKNFSSRLSQAPAISEFIEGRDKVGGAVLKVSAVSKTETECQLKLLSEYHSDSLEYFRQLLVPCVGKAAEDTAITLLSKYFTIENVFTASVGELSALCGEKCAFYLKLLAYITSRRELEKFSLGTKHSKAEIADYLKALYLGESVEKTYLICFDRKGQTVSVNMLSEGTVNSSEVLPRKAMELAIGSSAKSVSLAHNHPFGTTRASSDDLNLTKHFSALFSTCEIKLCDHYIIAGQLCDTVNFDF